jgi:membrane-bound ClpP family serine protease
VAVFGVVPSVFEIEWECVRGYGVVRTVGDSYLTSFAVIGAVGWIAVVAGTIYAHISERPRIALALPLAWFAALVLTSLAVGAAIGPARCGP